MLVAPIFRSLTEPVIILGVPRDYLKYLLGLVAVLQLIADTIILSLSAVFCCYLYGMLLTREDKGWLSVTTTLFRIKAGRLIGGVVYVA